MKLSRFIWERRWGATGKSKGREKSIQIKKKNNAHWKGRLSHACLTGTDKVKIQGLSLVVRQTACFGSTLRRNLYFMKKCTYCHFSQVISLLAFQRSIVTFKVINGSYFYWEIGSLSPIFVYLLSFSPLEMYRWGWRDAQWLREMYKQNVPLVLPAFYTKTGG